MKIAKVILDKASPAYDRPYDYIVPEALARAQAGCRVSVSFGAGNRTRVGWILDVCEAADTDVSRCKPIQALIDETPLLDGEALYLLNVLHETTFCTARASP
jgi:primosomal protein N' (replication factor Y)